MQAKHLNVPELSQRLGKSESYIYANWRRLGIPAIRIGQALRFPFDALLQWEEQNRA